MGFLKASINPSREKVKVELVTLDSDSSMILFDSILLQIVD